MRAKRTVALASALLLLCWSSATARSHHFGAEYLLTTTILRHNLESQEVGMRQESGWRRLEQPPSRALDSPRAIVRSGASRPAMLQSTNRSLSERDPESTWYIPPNEGRASVWRGRLPFRVEGLGVTSVQVLLYRERVSGGVTHVLAFGRVPMSSGDYAIRREWWMRDGEPWPDRIETTVEYRDSLAYTVRRMVESLVGRGR